MMSISGHFCLLLLATYAGSSPVKKTPRAAGDYRLPTTVLPSNYKVELTLADNVFTTNTFTGRVVITLTPQQAVTEIKLHASKITIADDAVELKQGATPVALTNENFQSDPVTEILTITPAAALAADTEYTLTISYGGILSEDEMTGFYKSSYVDSTGTVKYLATTQFQPTSGRRAFPCFDEPSFKATFEITIIHPSAYVARGNTPVTAAPEVAGTTTTVFRKTPVMPTYLVAFIVSDFTCSPAASALDDIPHQICSRDEAKDTRALAIDLGPRLLADLETYTGIRYSVSGIGKIDQVAIPDFSAGAMENWGLVTYRETALLWDPVESSNRYKQRVATVVAHELAHMWFGDLITTHWWSDTFLNEGFATYFEYHTTGSVLPGWELEMQFVIEQLQEVLQSDALESSNPLSHPASSPSEVSGRFSSVSYNKGGTIFRMVNSFMGATNFEAGINRYLTQNQFGNTEPKDLWDALNAGATNLPEGKTLGDVMENWVTKAGFPLITVKSDNNDVVLSQKRFLLSGANDATKWYVPISYTKSSDTNKFVDTSARAWLTPDQDLKITNALADADWFILNNKQTGYYRVDYDKALWDKIAAALKKADFAGIGVLNRAQIIDDLFNLAKSGLYDYPRVFSLLSFLSADTSYYSWYAAFTAFSHMLQRTGDARVRTALSEYILTLTKKLNEDIPFSKIDDDNQIFTHKKVLGLTWACRLGDKACVTSSKEAFAKYRTSGERPNANLRTISYCNALRNSDKIAEDWEFLWAKFAETDISTEQVTIISALGCTTDKNILNDYLTKSITTGSGIRRQDALSVFSAVYTGNPEGVDIAFQFLKDHHKEISDYYTSMNSMRSLINGITGRFTKQSQLEDLDKFSKLEELDETLQTYAQSALTAAKDNLKWTQSFEKQLIQHFKLDGDSAHSAKVGMFTVLSLFLMCYYLFY